MATVLSFPLPAEAEMSDAELASHLAGVSGKLLARVTDLEIENECLRSAWLSVWNRLERTQLRRLRFLITGAIGGAIVALVIDGTAAQKLDRLLTFLGWVTS